MSRCSAPVVLKSMTNLLLFICADFVNFNPVIKGDREVTLRTTVLKEDKGGKQSES